MTPNPLLCGDEPQARNPKQQIVKRMRYSAMQIKMLMTYDKQLRRIRICRVIYAKGKRQSTIGVEPVIYKHNNYWWPTGRILTLLFIRLHFKNSGGGIFV